jgi:tRNA dimethylallyltransferase
MPDRRRHHARDAAARLPGPVVAIVGPTGVGKSAVGEEVAVRLRGEIVSADSMQVYRGMDVGTAKRPPDSRRVPHWCLDLVDPGVAYSAALYQVAARSAIDGILARGAVPVVVGGSGLYVRAALDDMVFPSGQRTSPTRERLEQMAARLGPEGLHAYLAERDPKAAALIHRNNTRRVLRALEMLEGDSVSYADQHALFAERRSVYRTIHIGLTMDRDALYRRIDARVDAMLAGGLIDEVERLLAAGYRDALTATQAIGYKEFVPVIEGRTPLQDAADAVRQATRRYAKRQLTWFRADTRIEWLDVTGLSTAQAADAASALVESALAT